MGSADNGNFYFSVGQFQRVPNIVWIADWGLSLRPILMIRCG